ncbi:hypothetical protein P4S95_26305 [Aneurinibacillus aneurinilyticus]|uniref:hypothetical protein n=1 Tax=Aneurinibacillus aneurinilyticus TaxID=1391 RepID=UPI002E20A3E7|nr:hypothetical protein [Aneurinibacillus aneurinilyticus]
MPFRILPQQPLSIQISLAFISRISVTGNIVDWGIAIPITVGSVVGSHIGLKIVPYLKGKWIQLLLPIISLLLIVQVIADLLF